MNDITFTGIKYTSAGRLFAESQSPQTQEILTRAEKMMKNHRYTNLVVNKNGYAIQFADASGRHSYKIDEVLYGCQNNVNFHLRGKENKVFTFDFCYYPKKYHNCAVASSEDARYKNSFLNSSIELVNLLEKKGEYPLKPAWYDKVKKMINKSRLISFLF